MVRKLLLSVALLFGGAAMMGLGDPGLLPAAAQKEGKKAAKAKGKAKKPKLDVVYEPTPHDIVKRMLELAKVKKGELVYDLGCGDGRIVVAAAKQFGARGFGYDLDPKRIKESRANVKKNKVGKLVTIEQKDIFKVDLSKADVVTLYLLPDLNVKLLPQLRKLKPGARVVSHEWGIRGVKPAKLINVKSKEDKEEHLIYLWVAPLK
jgi:SAM-dependent methyltransferase